METCLFCLETSTLADNPVICINFSKYPDVCSCRIHSHIDCWMIYYLRKGQFECPICHTKFGHEHSASDHNITVHTENMVVQIRAPAPVPIAQIRENPSEEALRRNTLCVVCGCFCCMGLFFICLFVPVFMFFKH